MQPNQRTGNSSNGNNRDGGHHNQRQRGSGHHNSNQRGGYNQNNGNGGAQRNHHQQGGVVNYQAVPNEGTVHRVPPPVVDGYAYNQMQQARYGEPFNTWDASQANPAPNGHLTSAAMMHPPPGFPHPQYDPRVRYGQTQMVNPALYAMVARSQPPAPQVNQQQYAEYLAAAQRQQQFYAQQQGLQNPYVPANPIPPHITRQIAQASAAYTNQAPPNQQPVAHVADPHHTVEKQQEATKIEQPAAPTEVTVVVKEVTMIDKDTGVEVVLTGSETQAKPDSSSAEPLKNEKSKKATALPVEKKAEKEDTQVPVKLLPELVKDIKKYDVELKALVSKVSEDMTEEQVKDYATQLFKLQKNNRVNVEEIWKWALLTSNETRLKLLNVLTGSNCMLKCMTIERAMVLSLSLDDTRNNVSMDAVLQEVVDSLSKAMERQKLNEQSSAASEKSENGAKPNTSSTNVPKSSSDARKQGRASTDVTSSTSNNLSKSPAIIIEEVADPLPEQDEMPPVKRLFSQVAASKTSPDAKNTQPRKQSRFVNKSAAPTSPINSIVSSKNGSSNKIDKNRPNGFDSSKKSNSSSPEDAGWTKVKARGTTPVNLESDKKEEEKPKEKGAPSMLALSSVLKPVQRRHMSETSDANATNADKNNADGAQYDEETDIME